MSDLDRFWMDDGDAIKIDEGDDGGPDGAPGAAEEELAAWEEAHGVRLPETLRAALALRDGGRMRDAPVEILPLDRIRPVDEEFQDRARPDEEVEDWGLVFAFAEHAEVDLGFLLDYNARGPEGEPSVSTYTHGDVEIEPAAESFSEFVAAQVESDDGPAFDWAEAEGLAEAEVLAREVVEAAAWGGSTVRVEQVLARRGEGLVFYARQSDGEREEWSRTVLPGPLVAALANIRGYRPPPAPTFALHLQAEDLEGIVHVASSRSAGGGWRNSETRGAPCYVAFESPDRARLEALRSAVLGAAASVAEAREASQRAMHAKLAGMTPEERTAALYRAGVELREELLGPDSAPEPEARFPGLTSLSEILKRRIEEEARRAGAGAEIDPETLRVIREGLRPPGLDPAPPPDGA